jgi:hypothetical protein
MEYRVNPNAVYVEVCDEYLLVAVGEARGKLPQLRKLSEFGAGLKRVLLRKALFALSCRSMRFLVMKRSRGFLPLFQL